MDARKVIAIVLSALLAFATLPAVAEDNIADEQKLDASYTLALNAINAENYEVAKEYLDICFVYCDPQANPTMYADLLLKRACINVIEEKNDMALLLLEAALRVCLRCCRRFTAAYSSGLLTLWYPGRYRHGNRWCRLYHWCHSGLHGNSH